MKFSVTFSLLILFSSLALADVYFKDVPQGHWAEDAVYEMVRLGVTSGFPDGTFQGNKEISRFEVSSFLSKFSRYFKLRQGRSEKLIEELRSELSLIQYAKERADWETKISGQFLTGLHGVINQPREARFEPQLKLSLLKRLEAQSDLKINLDTMDAGFGPDWSSAMLTSLIDAKLDFKLGSLRGVASYGPGRVQHTEKGGSFPSENNTFYQRPLPELSFSSTIAKTSFSAAYLSRQTENSGKIDLQELTGKISSGFGAWRYSFQPHCLYKTDGPRDILTDFGISYKNPDWQLDSLFSVGSWSDSWSGCYARLQGEAKDPWNTGTRVALRLDKVGSKYRVKGLDEFELIDLNYSNRLIFDGSFDLGVKFVQRILNYFKLELKSDYVTNGGFKYGEAYPETYLVSRVGVDYSLSPASELNLFYQNYQVPSGLAQFNDPVPRISESVSFGIKSNF